ncbi:MAG: hypothetical protein U9O87_07730, partial [Verrucomicrobiota bacterium]|nr:hypothetical protein [Verrucomicrobiota bacterium]
MNLKYTVYGDSAFDKKIDGDMKLISETVLAGVDKNDITALILGGGYGRGEGGVISHDGKMQLYNDYDFFVITENVSMQRRNELNRELYEISEGLTEKIGIDVDFGPAVNKSRIPKTTFTMMWYELKNGHYVIYGNKNLLKDIPDYDGKNMPISEAASLLLNRGVGLMLARNKLAKNPQKNELEFAERNIYKALMACGDSFLISEKKFIYSYQKRQALLNDCKQEGIIAKYNFKKHYSDSIDYKLRPPYQPSS